MTVTIIVSPCKPAPYPKRWAGLFDAAVDGRYICTSRTPFVDAARVLVSEGCDINDTLQMRHAGSDVVALTATLGVAAGLSVTEGNLRPKFCAWAPFTALETLNGSASLTPEAATGSEDASQSHDAQKPWLAEGVSRATWFRRKERA